MQETSALYKEIIASGEYKTEVKLVMGGIEYGMSELASITTTRSAFGDSTPQLGLAVSGEIDVDLFGEYSLIPRMAEMRVYVRVYMVIQATPSADIVSDIIYIHQDASYVNDILNITDGADIVNDILTFDAGGAENDQIVYSEWLPKGTYWIDTREIVNDRIRIHGYDAMMKAEDDYPSSDMEWPAKDIDVVLEIAAAIDVEVDPRTVALMTAAFPIQLPTQYSMRETLAGIAGLYGGSFIMNDLGKLQLICPWDHPVETFYLTDEDGNRLVLGGNRILLD